MFCEPIYEAHRNKPFEIKALLEVAKLNDITIDDALFARLFEKVYEKPDKDISDEIKVTTETTVEKV